jgi:REP element-mobilizing transposase RayT
MVRMFNYIDEFPHSIGASCINKDWFGMPMDEVWDILEEYLYFVCHAYTIRVHCFILMSNHFHLMASGESRSLSAGTQFWLSQTSRQITKSAGRINHTWKANHFRRPILNPHYFLNAYKYFHRNPVEAKIIERVEDYPFSTLFGLLGRRQMILPVTYDDTLFSDVEGTLKWLNSAPSPEDREAMRLALRRSEFKLPRSKSGGLHRLETQLY